MKRQMPACAALNEKSTSIFSFAHPHTTRGALNKKLDALRKEIRGKGALAIGFSGGVDSSLLARAAHDVLGDSAIAVTIDSALLPRSELAEAKKVARLIGIRHYVVRASPLKDARFSANPPDRCYHCKKDDVSAIAKEAKRRGISCIAFGATASDLSEYRPGIKACEEMKVWQPLLELGFTKDEVRQAAKKMGLPVWNKPAAACLASRIAAGEIITKKKLKMVEEAENFLRSLGFDLARARMHDGAARIEVAPSDIPRAATLAGKIAPALHRIGFNSVALDLEGYRPGGANPEKSKNKQGGET